MPYKIGFTNQPKLLSLQAKSTIMVGDIPWHWQLLTAQKWLFTFSLFNDRLGLSNVPYAEGLDRF